MLRTPTLAARNRLAHTILAALHDLEARRELAALAESVAHRDGDTAEAADAETVRVRAEAAARALAATPSPRGGDPLDTALADAAVLFDAGLFFEMHEVLEPLWQDAGTGRAGGAPAAARAPLQGLIQIAVGYQHAANGNMRGARALLVEGAGRIAGRTLGGRGLDAFAAAVLSSLARIDERDATTVPAFPPRRGRDEGRGEPRGGHDIRHRAS